MVKTSPHPITSALFATCIIMNSCSIETSDSINLTGSTSIESNASKMEVFERTLANGLKIYLSPNSEEPRFYAEIVTRAGSKHDPSTNTGLAHYLEHLLFKGTSSFGTTDFQKEKPLLDKIKELYESRSLENNESRRKEIYEEINRVSQEAAKFAIPNEMDRMYSDMGGKGINAHTCMKKRFIKSICPPIDWNIGPR